MDRYDIALHKPPKKDPKKEEAMLLDRERSIPKTEAPHRTTQIIREDNNEMPIRRTIDPRGRWAHERALFPTMSNAANEEIQVQNAPTSRNFTITCPNGYHISIPLRYLNIRQGDADVYNGERQLIITLPVNNVQGILSDIESGQRRYGI